MISASLPTPIRMFDTTKASDTAGFLDEEASIVPEDELYRVPADVNGQAFNGEGTMSPTLAGDRIARLIIG